MTLSEGAHLEVYNQLLVSCAAAHDGEAAQTTALQMRDEGLVFDAFTYSSLVTALCRADQLTKVPHRAQDKSLTVLELRMGERSVPLA